MVNRRNNIVLVKRDVPKKLTLPNGRTFLAKYKRVNRQYLPGGTTIARTYRGQPARARRPTGGRRPQNKRARAKPAAAVRGAAWRRGRRQGGKGLTDVVKAEANNPFAQEIGKKLLTKGINSILGLFRKGTNKIKNKHLRNIAKSDIVPDLVDEGTKRIYGGIGL